MVRIALFIGDSTGVKILKDYTLIDRLGTSGLQTEHFVIKSRMKVQYINPTSPWSNNNWVGYNCNKWKISVDEHNSNFLKKVMSYR